MTAMQAERRAGDRSCDVGAWPPRTRRIRVRGRLPRIAALLLAVALILAASGCGQNETEGDAHASTAERSAESRVESDKTKILAWIYLGGGLRSSDVIFIDSGGEAFHFARDGESSTLHVYRDVRLPANARQQLLSAGHAATFDSKQEWSDFYMRMSVVCTDDASCSSFQCKTPTESLMDSYRLFEEALTTGERRLVPREQYDQLPLDRDLFPRDLSPIVESCNVAAIRPSWIAAAWEQANASAESPSP